MPLFDGKVAVVTGGGSGIGQAACYLYAREGAKVGGGAMVNMASILGQVGFENSPAYVAAKHGVVGPTKNAAMEYSKQGIIRGNSVGPGFIRTP